MEFMVDFHKYPFMYLKVSTVCLCETSVGMLKLLRITICINKKNIFHLLNNTVMAAKKTLSSVELVVAHFTLV